ncbi:hypothetical protein C8R44DRAFT_743726 [Mycena epipterygia]|nr:hypothetical protein C8R44DRAFT_743726 [Mycena epipterygia]
MRMLNEQATRSRARLNGAIENPSLPESCRSFAVHTITSQINPRKSRTVSTYVGEGAKGPTITKHGGTTSVQNVPRGASNTGCILLSRATAVARVGKQEPIRLSTTPPASQDEPLRKANGGQADKQLDDLEQAIQQGLSLELVTQAQAASQVPDAEVLEVLRVVQSRIGAKYRERPVMTAEVRPPFMVSRILWWAHSGESQTPGTAYEFTSTMQVVVSDDTVEESAAPTMTMLQAVEEWFRPPS